MYSAAAKARRGTTGTRWVLALLSVTLLVAGSGRTRRGGSNEGQGSRDPATIMVASFSFSESQTLGEIYAQVLERNGYRVSARSASPHARWWSRRSSKVSSTWCPSTWGPRSLSSRRVFDTRLDQRARTPAYGRCGCSGDRRADLLARAEPERPDGHADDGATQPPGQGERPRTDGRLARARRPAGCPERPFCLPGFDRHTACGSRSSGPSTVGPGRSPHWRAPSSMSVCCSRPTRLWAAPVRPSCCSRMTGACTPENVVPMVRRAMVRRHGHAFVALVDRVSAELETVDLIALNRQVDIEGVTPQRPPPGGAAHGFLDPGLLSSAECATWPGPSRGPRGDPNAGARGRCGALSSCAARHRQGRSGW